jgi:hypothetical protein
VRADAERPRPSQRARETGGLLGAVAEIDPTRSSQTMIIDNLPLIEAAKVAEAASILTLM